MAKASTQPAERVSIEQLHERLYGTIPRRRGEAYERLAAVVFAQLGWVDVEHDQLETTPGGTAEHQLDFVCRHPDGSVNRLVAQCKHWMDKVGKGEMDTLFGVQTQLRWDAAVVVTQVGFTRGARQVAADQDIAMVVLRPYAPETDDGRWWRGLTTTITWPFTSVTDVSFSPVELEGRHALAIRLTKFTQAELHTRCMTSSHAHRLLWEAGISSPIPPWRELEGIAGSAKDKPETTMTLADILVRDNAAPTVEYAHDTVAITAVKQDDADHRTGARIAMRCHLVAIAGRRPHGGRRRSAAHRNRKRSTHDRDDDSMHGYLSIVTDPRPRLARSGAWFVSPRSVSCPVVASMIISKTDPLGATAPYGSGA